MAITMQELAEMAGVSRSTVDRDMSRTWPPKPLPVKARYSK